MGRGGSRLGVESLECVLGTYDFKRVGILLAGQK